MKIMTKTFMRGIVPESAKYIFSLVLLVNGVYKLCLNVVLKKKKLFLNDDVPSQCYSRPHANFYSIRTINIVCKKCPNVFKHKEKHLEQRTTLFISVFLGVWWRVEVRTRLRRSFFSLGLLFHGVLFFHHRWRPLSRKTGLSLWCSHFLVKTAGLCFWLQSLSQGVGWFLSVLSGMYFSCLHIWWLDN